ncbi:MAG: hypothetical protein PSN37_04210 [Alphaproteobacteria bacterium]|nr:hypothetical protein [Alphaproteobacteria bacterium]
MIEFLSATGFYILSAALLTILKDYLLFLWRRRKDGVYSATRLIPILEEYVVKCAWLRVRMQENVAFQWPNAVDMTPDGTLYFYAAPIPDLPDFPADIIWHSLPKSSMRRSLFFPNMVRDEKRYLEGAWLSGDTGGSSTEKHDVYEGTATEALGIVNELREHYRIPVGKHWYQKNCNPNPEDYSRGSLSSLEEVLRILRSSGREIRSYMDEKEGREVL